MYKFRATVQMEDSCYMLRRTVSLSVSTLPSRSFLLRVWPVAQQHQPHLELVGCAESQSHPPALPNQRLHVDKVPDDCMLQLEKHCLHRAEGVSVLLAYHCCNKSKQTECLKQEKCMILQFWWRKS